MTTREYNLEERRRAPRLALSVPLQVPVEIRDVATKDVYHSFTGDISEVGAFIIAASVDTVAGDRLELSFLLPGSPDGIEASAVVSRVVPSDHPDAEPAIGVEFVELSEESAAVIRTFVAMHVES